MFYFFSLYKFVFFIIKKVFLIIINVSLLFLQLTLSLHHTKKKEEDFPIPKPMDCKHMSDFYTPWTVTHQALLSTGFPRQFWSGLPFLSPGDLPDPGVKPWSPELAGRFFITEPPGKPQIFQCTVLKEYCRCFNFTGISFVINTHTHTHTHIHKH